MILLLPTLDKNQKVRFFKKTGRTGTLENPYNPQKNQREIKLLMTPMIVRVIETKVKVSDQQLKQGFLLKK